ncbi:hypothetical protein BB561_006252 [Smittium simulii]|uniref:Uncharacterized protein n=1 Tax=Smittium simulii TaxID=133385 RepID=A0A2T9Y5J8_9FUNG|nr:hypothetical protein BB561_006252 [Smittium simulii]
MQQEMQENFFEALNDLTEKVQFLYIEREQQGAQQAQDMEVQNIECDNPHEKVRAPMVEVESYPGLIEAIPFRKDPNSYNTREKKKKIIYECPKFLEIEYTPPQLNEAAILTVRKNDAAPYGIQMAHVNLTRPINDYVHRKLKDITTRIQGNEDLEFAHTMRELLSDVASSITQNRIDNLHKLMGLPGRVPQIVESTVKPLVENKQLGALFAAKKPTAKNRRNKMSPFCPRQQTAFGTTSAMAQIPHSATPNTANNN